MIGVVIGIVVFMALIYSLCCMSSGDKTMEDIEQMEYLNNLYKNKKEN